MAFYYTVGRTSTFTPPGRYGSVLQQGLHSLRAGVEPKLTDQPLQVDDKDAGITWGELPRCLLAV